MLGFTMVDEQPTEPSRPVPSRRSDGGRRRGHRGGRGRGPRRVEHIPPPGPPADAPVLPEQKAEPPASAISRAIEEVTQIVETLKQTLDQMEEVLELVELAERQTLADEREIESLRRALHRIHRPRGEPPERQPRND